MTVRHSVVQGGWSNGSGVLDADPLFVAPVAATAAAAGNYRLRYGSPAIDYGTASGVTLPATDLDGQPRVTNAAVDAGAYEFQAYTLTVNRIGEGTVQRVPDQDAYTFLDQVHLAAVPAEGWVFTGWSGDVITTTNPLTITLRSNTVITATFSRLNRAPAFTSTPVTTAAQGAVYTYTVRVSDPDTGDVLAITAPAKPAWLTLTDNDNGTATLTGTPATPGAYEVVLRVTDHSGLSAEQRFTITVTRTRWEVFVPLITK